MSCRRSASDRSRIEAGKRTGGVSIFEDAGLRNGGHVLPGLAVAAVSAPPHSSLSRETRCSSATALVGLIGGAAMAKPSMSRAEPATPDRQMDVPARRNIEPTV
jgi:hypothetical protein